MSPDDAVGTGDPPAPGDGVATGAPLQPEEPAAALGRRTLVMATGTALSRLTGFGKFFALAYALGATNLSGTYQLANNTPNIIYELVLGGVLSGILVAVFVDHLTTKSDEEAWEGIAAVLSLATVVAAAMAALFVVVAPWFIRLYTLRAGQGLADDQLAVATILLRLFAPQVFFYGLISLSTALLNAQRRFAAPMWAPVINNLVAIAVFAAYPAVSSSDTLAAVRGDRAALLLLGLGTTAGVVAQALAQLPLRTLRAHVRWVWQPRHPAVGTIVRLSGWTIAFVAANQVALFVVFFLANNRPADVAIYNFAYTIFLLPHGVIAVSVMTAVAPEIAARWSMGDIPGARDQLSLGMRTVVAATAPAAVGYVLLARPITAVLLQHGSLRGEDAAAIARVLLIMATGLPAFSVFLYLTRAYQSIQETRVLFLIYLVENAINIVLAFALYPAFGVEGLAAAFSLAYWGGAAAGLVELRFRLRRLEGRKLIASAARVGAACATMGLAVAVVASAVGGEAGFPALVRVAAGVLSGVIVYLGAARVFRVAELLALLPTRRGN